MLFTFKRRYAILNTNKKYTNYLEKFSYIIK